MKREAISKTTFACILATQVSLALAATEPDTAAQSEVGELEEIVVRGTRQERYNVHSTTVGRLDQDILKIPRSITVIPEQVLLDQQVSDLGDALKNVSGLTDGDGFGGTLTDYFIRGFRRNSIFRNGVRLSQVTNNQPPTQNIESIEIIKGPASVLYGQIQPGGLVNIVTKKPSFQERGLAQVVIDEHGKRLATIDVTSPIGNGEDFAIRVNGSFERTDGFRDFYEIEREFFSPSLLWNIGENTSASLTYEYFKDNRPLDRGFVSLPDGQGGRYIPSNIPRSRRFGEDFEERDSQAHLVESIVEHRFSNGWNGTLSFMYRTEDEFDVQVRPNGIDELGNLRRRVDGTNDRTVDTLNFSAWASGDVQTGSINHQIAYGFDYRDESESRFFSVGQNVTGFNIFNPVYGLITDTRIPPGDPREFNEKAFGLFIQDQVSLTDRVSVLLGGRYDSTKGDSLANGNRTIINKKEQFTPQAGLLFQPTQTTTMYASYSGGFNPTTSVDPETGETFDPEEATQYEVGAKARFLDEKLQASIAIYDLEKNNIVALNGNGVLDLVGEVRSRGVELDVSGEVIPGMNILASYAYTDNEILTESDANRGNRTANVAEHTFRVWGSYEAKGGRFAGLGTGLGVNHTSDRFGDNSNTWKLGSYTLVDVAVWYYLDATLIGLGEGQQIRLGLNVKNLLDERYFPAAGNSQRINVGTPRTVIASLTYDF